MSGNERATARFAGTQHHSAYKMPFRIQNGHSGVNTPQNFIFRSRGS